MKEKIDQNKFNELFTRGVGEFIDPDKAFRKKLETAPENILIKFGVDPTRPDIHLGHAVVLRKLRQFQDLGCKVIFLAGDFTALIGDPTGKSKVRPEIDQKSASINMSTYIDQIPKILKIEPSSLIEGDQNKDKIVRDSNNFIVDSPWFGWMRNSEWFSGVTDITTEGASEGKLIIELDEQKIAIPPNSFLGKAVLYENTRMQKIFLKKGVRGVSLINALWVLRHISHSQLIERDMFKKRIESNEPLFMHEMLYPVFQGIDSDVLAEIYGTCDLEVGGTDQTFNMLIGRKVMEVTKKQPQAVLSFKLLEGLDGKEKMSKSLDNYIGVSDKPNDMYGKVMSIPDSSIINYFELCTDIPMNEVEDIRRKLEKNNWYSKFWKTDISVNPKNLKMRLAKEIVRIYHGEEKATQAEENFSNIFQRKGVPDSMTEVKTDKNQSLMDILAKGKIVSSKTDFRRLIKEGAITDLDQDKKITDVNFVPKAGQKFKIGKHRFVKIK